MCIRDSPAPEPDGEVIAGIKAQIAMELLGRKRRVSKRVVYKVAAVAAAFIILAVVNVKIFEKGGGPGKVVRASVLPAALWDSEDIAADDVDLAILTAEIKEIEEDVLALELGENGGNGHIDMAELEMELMEINGDFWEG